ncbi:MAG TPA: L,D-transpeptidase family protein [Solirubrobacteraceae bacterium]|nr:L,D-transpeptidase family protein [Solirubrobacteraceae bacterium]
MERPQLIRILTCLVALVSAPALVAVPTAAAASTPALHVSSVTPRGGTVAGNTTLTVRFSAPLATSGQPQLKLSPGLAGTWSQATASSLRFTPKSAYLPETRVHLTIPAGIKAADGAVLAHAVTATYRVGEPSGARLTQLLADLRYLPVHFVSRRDPRASDENAQLWALYSPPSGRFVFGHGWPAHLHWLWAVENSVVLRGALMDFESQRGLPMDGDAGPQVWDALIQARLHWRLNRSGYTYALASEASPESLTLWHNGAVVLRTPANTGIPGSGTAQGTFPVYQRLRSQVMQGTNPDGSHYADYVQWVAYFNGGDAVHYMPRSDYGSPQSLGCVELPYAAAERAWGFLSYGTLVSVLG